VSEPRDEKTVVEDCLGFEPDTVTTGMILSREHCLHVHAQVDLVVLVGHQAQVQGGVLAGVVDVS
jgi:hypothetical protein